MGDNINLDGDFRGANIPIQSVLEDVTISINNNHNIDQSTQEDLEKLFLELNKVLENTPMDKIEEAEAIVKTAQILVEAATEKEPNKTMTQITSESLLKAAENLAKVMPPVLSIVKQIIALLVHSSAI